jgi:hypothetical protein
MCTGKVIRQAGYGKRPDVVLIPTTRDEVGQYGPDRYIHRGPQVTLEWCADGTLLWDVTRPFIFRHPAEEDVLVEPGLYIARIDRRNWGGAPTGDKRGSD